MDLVLTLNRQILDEARFCCDMSSRPDLGAYGTPGSQPILAELGKSLPDPPPRSLGWPCRSRKRASLPACQPRAPIIGGPMFRLRDGVGHARVGRRVGHRTSQPVAPRPIGQAPRRHLVVARALAARGQVAIEPLMRASPRRASSLGLDKNGTTAERRVLLAVASSHVLRRALMAREIASRGGGGTSPSWSSKGGAALAPPFSFFQPLKTRADLGALLRPLTTQERRCFALGSSKVWGGPWGAFLSVGSAHAGSHGFSILSTAQNKQNVAPRPLPPCSRPEQSAALPV